ncbi:hypothetical protein BACEGG_00776 [Bacteroides eggerthii DSM 20697]|uniref:Uncharacterized protein n=1 Tax=Bacteroides eggerthii 1_2_48FAA TaxID=665953 RepID=E5WXR0_9BACE|nr:hypothetical protein BACEGG_00776 [Bacteroides eggerthii DSM 20697]EFV30315.1 hypothetical protein HMPREF1016_01421 [Bacteroides eggerthii 1_2_48FAA]
MLFYLRTKLSKRTGKSRNRVTYSRIIFQYVKERFYLFSIGFAILILESGG